MAEERESPRRNAGTYLYVREGARRAGRARAEGTLPPPSRAPLVTDSFLEPLGPPTGQRVRYVRPRLDAAALDPHLVFLLRPEQDEADLYRDAAARLMAARPADRRLLVTSPLAGAGKTLTCLNLAGALAEQHRVTIVDLHAARPGLAAALALDPQPDLAALVAVRHRDRHAPIDLHLIGDRLAVLPLGRPIASSAAPQWLGRSELGRVFEEVAETSDIILFDGPPVLDEGLTGLGAFVSTALLVVRPAELGSGAYEAALAGLTEQRVVGTLVNGAPGPDAPRGR